MRRTAALMALVVAMILSQGYDTVDCVPFPPETVERLKKEGAWEETLELLESARTRGMDRVKERGPIVPPGMHRLHPETKSTEMRMKRTSNRTAYRVPFQPQVAV